MKIKRVQDKKGRECFFIDVTVWVAKPELCNGQKQLRRNRYVPLSECPDKQTAREIGTAWEKELSEKANGAARRNLIPTYRQCAEHYLKHKSSHYSVTRVADELGDEPIDARFYDKFTKWVKDVAKEEKRKWKLVDGKKKLVQMEGTKVSKDTLTSYRRYTKTVLNYCASPEGGRIIPMNPLTGMHVGKTSSRMRRLTEEEEEKIFKVIDEKYPWFRPAVMFAMRNPIRPQDQFSLRQSKVFNKKDMTIIYTPQKTEGRTNRVMYAHPIISEELRPHFENLPDSQEMDFLFWRMGYKRLGEDPAMKYPITNYKGIWDSVCSEAGLKGICFYHLRHAAVSYLRRKGFPDWAIQLVGGWASLSTMAGYDVNDGTVLQDISNSIMLMNKGGEDGSVFSNPMFKMITNLMSLQQSVSRQ